MALLLNSKGKIQDDLKAIAIERLNLYDENAYNNLDKISKKKIDDYTEEQAIAMRAFLERQELKITNMEAVGMIYPNQIKIVGSSMPVPTLGAPAVFTGNGVPGSPGYATNGNNIPIMVQISRTSNKFNLPEVFNNVKKTIVRCMESIF